MPTDKMHADEVDIDIPLVNLLLTTQFPEWTNLPIRCIQSAGTDNAIYRLGDDMAVRLPRHPRAMKSIDKECQWLPKLAPHLPLPIPVPLAKGLPGEGYPFCWSICQWLDGENATRERIANLNQMATDLADFIMALQQINPSGGPIPDSHNFYRGVPLATRDTHTRAAIKSLDGAIDTSSATAVWEIALNATVYDRSPVWIHGDLQSGNLLVQEGRLSGVIDFGGLGVGDPACDLMVAWNLLDAESRAVFRRALSVDDATWARGRGWALSVALIALPYYQNTNPVFASTSRYTIAEVLADAKIDDNKLR